MTVPAMRRALLALAIVPILIHGGASPAGAQFLHRDPNQPDMTLDAAARSALIDATLRELKAGYVFPDRAIAMEAAIRRRQAAHEYDGISSATTIADSLTAHLRAVARDKHLRVLYSYDVVPDEPEGDGHDPARMIRMEREGRKRNFGFERVERLAGNVGYLELRQFAPSRFAGPVVESALAFLSNTDALIIDLRRNGGGDGVTVALLCSYFLPPGDRRLLNTVIIPRDDMRIPSWSLAEVPGPRYVDRPVYILTGPGTFSAAEEFAYNMQSMKRATIVGQASGGGAHPVQPVKLGAHFLMSLPFARSENPLTHTNWEGVGVKPDVDAPEDEALLRAHQLGLRTLIAQAATTDERQPLEQALEGLAAGAAPGWLPTTGDGGVRRIIVTEGN